MDKILLNEKCKQMVLLFAFGLLGGCIYFHILWRMQGTLFQNEWGMILNRVTEYPLQKWIELMLKRWYWIVGFHIVLCFFGFMKMGKIVIQGMVLAGGVVTGAMETLLLLSFHIKNAAIFLLKITIVVFPHIVLIGLTLVWACSLSFLRWTSWEKTRKWKMIQLKKYTVTVFITLILHLVYIIMMSYVNYGKIIL